MPLAAGIDLGTTYSCISIYRPSENRTEIINNLEGERTTPSYVAFTADDEEELVGRPAMLQAGKNRHGTIFDAKRLIGHGYKDAEVQADMRRLPFKIIEENGQPVFEINVQGKTTRTVRPEQISGMILKRMCSAAESYLGDKITEAVITVPAYFNDSQRRATKDAGALAELNVLRIINEPTAAAIAYGFDKRPDKSLTVLVFDLGGGTFDVSLFEVKNGDFDVRSIGGNAHLGGQDFVARLVKYVTEDFTDKHKTTLSDRALSRLHDSCEQAKILLSSSTSTSIDIESRDIEYSITITRAKFEQLCEDIFLETIKTVDRVIEDGKMTKTMIDEVILIGGSTRIPKIRDLLTNFFDGKKLNEQLNPAEAVANGAAIMAASLSGVTGSEFIDDMVLHDVTPMSLGVAIRCKEKSDVMDVLIPRNYAIPAQMTRDYTTFTDFQERVDFEVYEGEYEEAKRNHVLGKITLEIIDLAEAGVPRFDVLFQVDEEGILNVSATDRSTGTSVKTIIKSDRNRLSKEEIEQMIEDAAKNRHKVEEDGERGSEPALESSADIDEIDESDDDQRAERKRRKIA